MERAMKKPKLPKIDSVQKLAQFWDRHDLTDFEDELEQVKEPVFRRGGSKVGAIQVPLGSHEVQAVERIAHAEGVSSAQLVRSWVMQRLARRTNGRSAKR
jgi:hypothetical protein